MTVTRAAISRRRALTGAATAGIGLPLLAACGDDGGDTSAADPDTSSTNTDTSSPKTDTSSPKSDTSSGKSDTSSGEGIPTSEVPVGGGIVVSEEQVVITQPTAGEFHAFTSVCTHAGCPVARVGSEIECDCHGSRFSIEDGSVTGGPAPSPLAAVDLTVSGDRIVLG